MSRILFVCLGNICRSPSAEAVFQSLIEERSLRSVVSCDSAGLIGYHEGEPADSRMRQIAQTRGYTLTSISRPFNPTIDFDAFDFIIGMDSENIDGLLQLARSEQDKHKIYLMTDFCSTRSETHVPDPYYGGRAGFELVLDILEDACLGLMTRVMNQEKDNEST